MIHEPWPDLIGCLCVTEPPIGMLPRERLVPHGSIGRHPEHVGRVRLATTIDGLVAAAMTLAEAIGPEAAPRSEILMSLLPTAPGAAPDACCAWRAAEGRTFVASTIALPSLTSALDARFAGFEGFGRARELDGPPTRWASSHDQKRAAPKGGPV